MGKALNECLKSPPRDMYSPTMTYVSLRLLALHRAALNRSTAADTPAPLPPPPSLSPPPPPSTPSSSQRTPLLHWHMKTVRFGFFQGDFTTGFRQWLGIIPGKSESLASAEPDQNSRWCLTSLIWDSKRWQVFKVSLQKCSHCIQSPVPSNLTIVRLLKALGEHD